MPRVEVRSGRAADAPVPALVLPWVQGEGVPEPLRALDEAVGGGLAAAVERGDLRGARDEVLVLPGPRAAGPRRLVVCGVGPRAELSLERLRRAAGAGAARARALRCPELAVWFPAPWWPARAADREAAAQALVEGAVLGTWRYEEYKTVFDDASGGPPVPVASVTLWADPEVDVAPLESGARVGAVLAECQNRAREWVNRPPNRMTPSALADEARAVAEAHGFRVTVWGAREIEREGLSLLLAVARGSDEEPRFVVLEADGGSGPPLALVGKGVTFDSGGLSLKTSEQMEWMKADMAGAAAVLGAADAVGRLGWPVRLVVVVPATENLPSGRATKPGDIVRSHAGKTVEILNTDAEGRLILADALAYAARRFRPAAMVDAATLTGACVVALGHHAIGLFTPDDGLADELRAAGERSGERVWRLPLWEEYREQLRSENADLKNVGGRPAGAITAAWFLREFAGEVPWAHLDIAGTAWAEVERPYQPKGATGVGVRLLAEWVRARL